MGKGDTYVAKTDMYLIHNHYGLKYMKKFQIVLYERLIEVTKIFFFLSYRYLQHAQLMK